MHLGLLVNLTQLQFPVTGAVYTLSVVKPISNKYRYTANNYTIQLQVCMQKCMCKRLSIHHMRASARLYIYSVFIISTTVHMCVYSLAGMDCLYVYIVCIVYFVSSQGEFSPDEKFGSLSLKKASCNPASIIPNNNNTFFVCRFDHDISPLPWVLFT